MNQSRVETINAILESVAGLARAVSQSDRTPAGIEAAVQEFRSAANTAMRQYQSSSHTDGMKASIDRVESEGKSEFSAPSDEETQLVHGAFELARAGKEKALAISKQEDADQAIRYLYAGIDLLRLARRCAADGR